MANISINSVKKETMVKKTRPRRRASFEWTGYLIGIGLVILATWLKYLAQPTIIPADVPILYILAIVPTAIFFGLGPSILVCFLSLLAYDYFFIPPLYALNFFDIQNAPVIMVFLLVGIVLSYMASNLRQKNRQAAEEIAGRERIEAELEEYRDRLEDMVRQRTVELEKAKSDLEQDISERKLLQSKLEEMATHDHLTGLPNRVLLLDRFSMAAALAHRNKARLAVLLMDVDNFKAINDTFGHEFGDRVLKAIGNRLSGVTRASDTFARLGGDEFMLIMTETNQRKDAVATAQKILDSFGEPFSIEGRPVSLSTSIGIAIYPDDAEDMETLMKKSDAAMYFSKAHGRNQFKFFNDGDVQIGGVNAC
jgi:diguanylate cyclase (GGDEF)-like protein